MERVSGFIDDVMCVDPTWSSYCVYVLLADGTLEILKKNSPLQPWNANHSRGTFRSKHAEKFINVGGGFAVDENDRVYRTDDGGKELEHVLTPKIDKVGNGIKSIRTIGLNPNRSSYTHVLILENDQVCLLHTSRGGVPKLLGNY